MRAEGFTRGDAFLQLNFHPRKQVNPLMTQEQEQQLSQTMLAMMQSGGDAPKSTVEVPAYFCRLFHEKTGQHFSTFLTRTRMEKAQMMLSSKEPQTLGEISAACGYPNKSYFCQVFKKYTGMTPGEYQAMAKEK